MRIILHRRSEGTIERYHEATMRVNAISRCAAGAGLSTPKIEGGIDAMYECVRQECMPTMVRLSDPDKTALSLAFRPPALGFVSKVVGSLFQKLSASQRLCPAQHVPDADRL